MRADYPILFGLKPSASKKEMVPYSPSIMNFLLVLSYWSMLFVLITKKSQRKLMLILIAKSFVSRNFQNLFSCLLKVSLLIYRFESPKYVKDLFEQF